MTIPLGMSLFCSAQESAMLTTPRRVRRTPAASLCCQLLFFYVDVMLYLAYKSLSSNMEGQWRHSGRQKPSRHTDVILVMWRLAFFAGERICCDYHGKEGVCYQRLYSITLSMDPLLLLQRNLFYTIEPYLWSVLLIPLNVRGAVFFEAIYSQKKTGKEPPAVCATYPKNVDQVCPMLASETGNVECDVWAKYPKANFTALIAKEQAGSAAFPMLALTCNAYSQQRD